MQCLPNTPPRGTTRRPLLPHWKRARFWAALAVLVSALAVLPTLAGAEEEAAAIERRLHDAAGFLASDECEGRGPGSKGIDLAADYIARQFQQLGLSTERFDGQPFQKFPLSASAEIGPETKLTLRSPAGDEASERVSLDLKLSDDFSPMAASSAGEFDLPLAFVGYGITAKDKGYDDYAGLDVKGKLVVILRHEPQQADPNSVFDGKKNSAHASFRSKLENAREHGAAGVIFCTDEFEIRKTVEKIRRQWQAALDRLALEHEECKNIKDPTLQQIEAARRQIDELMRQVDELSEKLADQCDPVMPFRHAASGPVPEGFPVVHCRREVLDRAVEAALGTDLAELERQIDAELKPRSRDLTPWRAAGRIDVKRQRIEVKNIVAVLPGEGPKADEALVVGAHYDHVGYGRQGADKGEIYNGADDNASGVAVMLEVARVLAQRDEKPARSVVFVAFTAEERGLIGSRHYADNPVVPMKNTVAMINLDMVGRLRDEKLTVYGTGTASGFDELLDRIGPEHGLTLIRHPSGFGPSDHASFTRKEIPVLFFITGFHKDVHRPSDDADKLNVPGMRRISRLVSEVAVALADAEERPQYVAVASPQARKRAFFGCSMDSSYQGKGFAVNEVVKGGPADQAGLQSGDVVVRLGQRKIGSFQDMLEVLQKHKGGDCVEVEVQRGDKRTAIEVKLGPPQR